MKFKILVTLALLALLSGAYGVYMFTKKVPTLENTATDFYMSATQLYSDFEQDEVAANAKYVGKVIEVEGMIESINMDTSQQTIILQVDSSAMGGVNFSLNDSSSLLKTGQKIKIKGQCQGFLMDVILNNAYVVTEL